MEWESLYRTSNTSDSEMWGLNMHVMCDKLVYEGIEYSTGIYHTSDTNDSEVWGLNMHIMCDILVYEGRQY